MDLSSTGIADNRRNYARQFRLAYHTPRQTPLRAQHRSQVIVVGVRSHIGEVLSVYLMELDHHEQHLEIGLSQNLFEIISEDTRTDSFVAQRLDSLFMNQSISRISV